MQDDSGDGLDELFLKFLRIYVQPSVRYSRNDVESLTLIINIGRHSSASSRDRLGGSLPRRAYLPTWAWLAPVVAFRTLLAA